MRFDYLSGLSADLRGPFLDVFCRRLAGPYHCLQSRRDRNLLADVTQHPFDSASEHCKYSNLPHSNCIGGYVESAVGEAEALAPFSIFPIGLQCAQKRLIHGLKRDFGQSFRAWAARLVLQLCFLVVCIAYSVLHIQRLDNIFHPAYLNAIANRQGFKGFNLSRNVLAGQELRSQESEVSYKLDSGFWILDSIPAIISRFKLEPDFKVYGKCQEVIG